MTDSYLKTDSKRAMKRNKWKIASICLEVEDRRKSILVKLPNNHLTVLKVVKVLMLEQ